MSADILTLSRTKLEDAQQSTTEVLVDHVRRSIDKLRDESFHPTGIVCVAFDDEGRYSTHWHTESSPLPAAAFLGLAIKALTSA